MSVPVFLRLNDANKQNQSEKKIADAIIVIDNDKNKTIKYSINRK